MDDLTDPKAALRSYLQRAHDGLVMNLDGLPERELRLPRTPTGTNLLGIVKHVLNCEYGYLGLTFGRAFPTPHELVPLDAFDTDPQADWYATSDETAEGILDLYRRVRAFTDETIDALPLDARGRVPWWPAERAEVTLAHVLIRVIDDTSRHAGQADIIREHIDGAVGLNPEAPNIPDDVDWPAYVAKLTAIADRF